MPIDHVVLLCMENRSFDHMLGYLDHPDPEFAGLRHGGFSNTGADGAAVPASPHAKTVLPSGPDHAHDSVMLQIALTGLGRWRKATNLGFVSSYERMASGLARPSYAGPLGWVRNHLPHRKRVPGATGRGPLVMLCHDPAQVPVLSTLALEFAVCDHWFCSVPGETWPNRNYLHAATSDGETNIAPRFYSDDTIFDRIGDAGRTWRIYHDGMPQVWAFNKLWDTAERHANWFPMQRFYDHVRAGDLPTYTFIEPNHKPPVYRLNQVEAMDGEPGRSNSQHPDNNLVDDDVYDAFVPRTETDFERGERLIAAIYEALRANPALFERTALVITYDEHGGFYDHLGATERVVPPGDKVSLLGRVTNRLMRQRSQRFGFDRLGVRVPTVIVSPLIAKGTLESRVLEHSSVPATLRAMFAPRTPALTRRDARANTFHHLFEGRTARSDLPDLSAYVAPAGARRPQATPGGSPEPNVPSYFGAFLAQTETVREHLVSVAEPEAAHLDTTTSLHDGDAVADAFARAAERHRDQAAASV